LVDPESAARLEQLVAELSKDPLNNAETLGPLSKESPKLVALDSVDPLQAIVVFAPRRPQMPHTVFLWAGDGASCERLLDLLDDARSAYWLSTPDVEAAAAVRRWAAEVTWEAEEINHAVTDRRFRLYPHPEVRMLTEADGPAVQEPRPHVARALAVHAAGKGNPNRFFGMIRGGTWCGDGFCINLYGDVWTVADIAVAEGCRRQGIGKGLVTACTRYILDQGGRPTYQADVRNGPSIRLCEALGYVPIGRRFRFEVRSS
jgi:GNAT superfamily N-acetyltransferase